jgi:hypothetical protein
MPGKTIATLTSRVRFQSSCPTGLYLNQRLPLVNLILTHTSSTSSLCEPLASCPSLCNSSRVITPLPPTLPAFDIISLYYSTLPQISLHALFIRSCCRLPLRRPVPAPSRTICTLIAHVLYCLYICTYTMVCLLVQCAWPLCHRRHVYRSHRATGERSLRFFRPLTCSARYAKYISWFLRLLTRCASSLFRSRRKVKLNFVSRSSISRAHYC